MRVYVLHGINIVASPKKIDGKMATTPTRQSVSTRKVWRNAGSRLLSLNANNNPSSKHFESKRNYEIAREYGYTGKVSKDDGDFKVRVPPNLR